MTLLQQLLFPRKVTRISHFKVTGEVVKSKKVWFHTCSAEVDQKRHGSSDWENWAHRNMNAPHGSGVDFFVVVLLLHGAIRKFCVTTTWHCCFHTQKESGLHIFYVPDFCYQHCHFHAPLIYSKLNELNFSLFQCKSAEHLTIAFAPGKEEKKYGVHAACSDCM